MAMRTFASLFKKYRLRSEIQTLSEFGDLLAEEGIVYENSLYTRWQRGERVPRERKVILAIIKVFVKHDAISSMEEVSKLLESTGQRDLYPEEYKLLPVLDNRDEMILTTSLGGMIKDYRIQQNMSELEASLAVGWDDNSNLRKIESGEIKKPPRQIIDKLCHALQLKNQEKNQILYTGNYLPTEEEVNKIRKEKKDLLNSWAYPAVLLDFSWRIISENDHNKHLYHYPVKIFEDITNNLPTVIEVLFNPDLSPYYKLTSQEQKEWRNSLLQILIQFRTVQQRRTKEDWYQNLMKKMIKNDLFRRLWQESLNIKVNSVTKYSKKIFPMPENPKKRLNMNIFIVPLIEDPRFEIEFHTPSNLDTFLYFSHENYQKS